MHKKILGIPVVFLLINAIFASAFLYKDSFTGYFFQDDWFTWKISSVKNLTDVFKFFIPRQDVIYYRPLGMQVPFFLLKSLFGINSLAFHIVTFATHAINIVLVYLLINSILKKSKLALFSAFIYATSAVHLIPFYWFSTYPFVLGPTAFFLSFWLYIKSQIQGKGKIIYIFSIITYGLGILVNEMVIILPAVILLYLLLFPTKKSFKILIPYFLIALIILLLRFGFYPAPVKESYNIGLGMNIISNFKTYFFWSFNWSEIITEQMIRPFIFNNLIMQDYANYAYVSILTLVTLSIIILSGSFLLIKSKKNKSSWKFVLLGVGWFMIGLSPVIFFSGHKFAYYLPISLVGLLLVLNVLFEAVYVSVSRYTKILGLSVQILILLLWILTSVVTIDLGIKQHWAPRRAKISKFLIDKVAKDKSVVENIVYIDNTSENKLALNDQDALKIIFNNDSIITIYGPQ